jgi:hypothetical protein
MVSIKRPLRRSGVGPCVAERAETGCFACDRRQRVQEVASGSREPVEPGHHQHVARVELIEQTAELRPVGLGSARDFAEHLARPVLPECGDLSGDALAVGGYPCIAVNHKFILHQNSATEKANRFRAVILVRFS